MKKPRLVPKVVFRVAAAATAVPAIALGALSSCKHQEPEMTNPVAQMAYTTDPPPREPVEAAAPTVEASAPLVATSLDASVGVTDAARDATDAARDAARDARIDAARAAAPIVEPSSVRPYPDPHELLGVAYRGYDKNDPTRKTTP